MREEHDQAAPSPGSILALGGLASCKALGTAYGYIPALPVPRCSTSRKDTQLPRPPPPSPLPKVVLPDQGNPKV